jgi:hypothetical protein
MTYPNPAGYYLPLPEAIETEISKLTKDRLLFEIADLVFAMRGNYPIETAYLSPETDEALEALSEDNKISLLRWMTERLAWLQKQEKANDAQP